MDEAQAAIEENPRRGWVIFVVQYVRDRPSQVRFQRVVALASEFNVVVVTNSALPKKLEKLIHSVVIARSWRDIWIETINVGKKLKSNGQRFYVHTQYSPIHAMAGYLCKLQLGSKWIYDLWDHPSLTYRERRGFSRWLRAAIELGIRRWVLPKADAWVVAMHPGVLECMPLPLGTCRKIFTAPGVLSSNFDSRHQEFGPKTEATQVHISYAGPVISDRLHPILDWIKGYAGPPVLLRLIGAQHGDRSGIVDIIERSCSINERISVEYLGELPLSETIAHLRDSAIGICPLDTSILNYRYAFPIKVIEQMSLGLIVVATESDGVCAYLKDGVNGIIIRDGTAGTSSAMDRAIQIAVDHKLKDEMTKSAVSTVRGDTWYEKNKCLIKQINAVIP